MQKKPSAENGIFKRVKNDYDFRTVAFSALSFLISLIFIFYNGFIGIANKNAWSVSIAVYYALLTCIRIYIVSAELKFLKNKYDDKRKEAARINVYFAQSILLLIIDLALITPISLMTMQQKKINYTTVTAIVSAAYTTYKITTASINFKKTRKASNLSVKALRNVNFIDALVSVLSLQYVLIMTFGGSIEDDMLVLCCVVTFAIWLFIIVISIKSLVQTVKIRKAFKLQKLSE